MSGCSNAIASTRRPSSARSSAAPGAGRSAQVDDRVAASGDAVVELDDRARRRPAWPPACAPARRRRRRRRARPRSRAGAATPASANSRRQPVLVPNGRQTRIGAVERDAERQREIALERRRRVRARGGSAPASGISARISASTRGRASSFSASERAEPSCVATMCRRRAGLPGDDARQQPEVVLDHALGHRAPGHVDHAHPRLAQQEQQEQHALLERLQRRVRSASRRA